MSCSSVSQLGPAPEVFREAAAEAGLVLHHSGGATGHYFMPEIIGSGAALFDYDNDGDLDVYLVQGHFLEQGKTMEQALQFLPNGWRQGNRLFRNELIPEGRLRFTDVTEQAGVGHVGIGMGVATGDIDNDGYLDLYITNFGPNVLLRNLGNGRFADITATAGVSDPRWSTSAAFFDYDRDGDLDLYCTNYVDFTVPNHKYCKAPHGGPDYCGPQVYNGVPDRLFRNDGGGRFTDVTAQAGINRRPGPGLGVTTVDFNEDGWVDIYIANDGKANHLWINQKDGTFVEDGLKLGAAYAETGRPRAGMGVTAEDADGDGRADVVVTNLTNEGSTLFGNVGVAGFFDVSGRFGLSVPTIPYTGFGVGWFDYDHDGWLDLFMANGAVKVEEKQAGSPYPYLQKNLLIRNEEGKRLVDVSASAGAALQLMGVHRAAAFGDIDNDGDIDIVVTNNNGPVRLLLNETGNRKHWLLARLDGGTGNRFGYGARLELRRKGKPPLWRKVQSDYSYLAANDCRVHFGLGDSREVEAIIVHWPDGATQAFAVEGVDRILTLRR